MNEEEATQVFTFNKNLIIFIICIYMNDLTPLNVHYV